MTDLKANSYLVSVEKSECCVEMHKRRSRDENFRRGESPLQSTPALKA